jgi:hypothetical protein
VRYLIKVLGDPDDLRSVRGDQQLHGLHEVRFIGIDDRDERHI